MLWKVWNSESLQAGGWFSPPVEKNSSLRALYQSAQTLLPAAGESPALPVLRSGEAVVYTSPNNVLKGLLSAPRQHGLALYTHLADLFEDRCSVAPRPLSSWPNPPALCLLASAPLWCRGRGGGAVASCDWFQGNALFAWAKVYKAMPQRAVRRYLHLSSLFYPRPLVSGSKHWPVLNHPLPSPYPVEHFSITRKGRFSIDLALCPQCVFR